MAGTGGRVEEPGRRETVTSAEDVVGLSVLPDASGGGVGAMAATGRVASPRDGHPAASWPACVMATAEVEAGRLEESGGPARGQVRRSSSFVSTATKCDRSPPMHIDHIVLPISMEYPMRIGGPILAIVAIVRTMVILNGRKSRSGPCYGTAPEQGNSCYKRCSGART